MTPEEIAAAYAALGALLETIENALVVVQRALAANPERNERRTLEEDLLELEAKRVQVNDRMLALGSGTTTITPPSAAQVAEIQALARQVDDLTRGSVSGQQAVTAVGSVLDLAARVMRREPPPPRPNPP